MSEFIMGYESQKKKKTLSPALEQRALASGQNSGFAPAPRFLSWGSLPPRARLPAAQPSPRRKGLRVPGAPARQEAGSHRRRRGPQPCLAEGPPPQLQAELPSSAVPRANPGRGRHTRGSQCPEVGAGVGPPEDAGGARGGGA